VRVETAQERAQDRGLRGKGQVDRK
jgi:hypothetical protein